VAPRTESCGVAKARSHKLLSDKDLMAKGIMSQESTLLSRVGAWSSARVLLASPRPFASNR
jgi:hypothetical protein